MSGQITASSNVIVFNLSSSGTVTASGFYTPGQITASYIIVPEYNASGTITASGIYSTGQITSSGNVIVLSLSSSNTITASRSILRVK